MKMFRHLAMAMAAITLSVACNKTTSPEPTPEPTPEPPTDEPALVIEVTDITPYTAELKITPSADIEEYACVFIAKEQVPLYDDEYSLMMGIIDGFQPAIFNDVLTETLKPLMPASEYVVLAFGIENNIPTTDLYRYDFTSAAAETSGLVVESIELIKLFDSQEIIALNSSYASALGECECVGIVEIKTSQPTDKTYFWWYEGWMRLEYTDEAFLEDLLLYDYANNPEIMDMYYSLDDSDVFLFAGIAEDDNGNLSPLYYSDSFLLSKDMCDPAEEFFQYVQTRSATTFIFAR